MKRVCGNRHPDSGGIIRCDLAHRHRGQHQAELRGHLHTWGDDVRDALPRRRRANSTLQETSEHNAAAEIFTDGIKADRIWRQIENGHLPYCEKCICDLTNLRRDGDLKPMLQAPLDMKMLALEQAMTNSAKHHVRRRTGHGYRPVTYGHDFGHDSPFFIEAPLCHSCHTGAGSEVHPGPAFWRSGT